MSCVSCNSADHGGPDGVDFVCFKCLKVTYKSGTTANIRRSEGYWEIELALTKKLDVGYWEIELALTKKLDAGLTPSHWLSLSHSFEEMYELYLARLIVS